MEIYIELCNMQSFESYDEIKNYIKNSNFFKEISPCGKIENVFVDIPKFLYVQHWFKGESLQKMAQMCTANTAIKNILRSYIRNVGQKGKNFTAEIPTLERYKSYKHIPNIYCTDENCLNTISEYNEKEDEKQQYIQQKTEEIVRAIKNRRNSSINEYRFDLDQGRPHVHVNEKVAVYLEYNFYSHSFENQDIDTKHGRIDNLPNELKDYLVEENLKWWK